MLRKKPLPTTGLEVQRTPDVRSGRLRSERHRSEAVYREIHAAIVERRLPAGARLPEGQLSKLFGVSRTLVRQALQRLIHDHLAVQEPNKSVRVAAPSTEEVRHLYEVRRLIECALIAGTGRLGRPSLACLRSLVTEEARANAAGDMRMAMQLADTFHLELARATGNPILVEMLGELIARGNVAISLYEQPGRANCRCDEHKRILKHLADGAHDQAIGEMRAHLAAIEQSLCDARDTRKDGGLAEIFGRAPGGQANKDRT
jgi:DNA-binding GntR family transcriptional regulator